MELFLLFLQIPILIIIINYCRKLNSNSLIANSYYYILAYKVAAGMFLGVFYYNSGDTFRYYNDLDVCSKIFYKDFGSYLELLFLGKIPPAFMSDIQYLEHPRALLFVQILSPFYIFTGSNYWMLSVYLSLFSFIGALVLSNTLINIYNLNPLAILFSFFGFPSVVLWSSGLMKESLIFGIICLIISFFLNILFFRSRKSASFFPIIIIFSLILLVLKFYYFAVLFAVLLPYCFVKYYAIKFGDIKFKKSYQAIVLLLLIIIFSFIVTVCHPMLNLNVITEMVYSNYLETIRNSNNNNIFTFEGLSSDPLSFIRHIPKAFIYGLFSPFLWQCKKVISFVNWLENTLVIILFITFLFSNFRKNLKIGIEEISIVIYIVILSVFMAFASPNMGSLVRYKIGYLPFFLLLILNNNYAIIQLGQKFKVFNLENKKS